MTKVKPIFIKYFDLFELLDGLESDRPGIRKRIWDFISDEKDIQFQPIKGRILNINLFYYGVGDEYPLSYLKKYPSELEHCKKTHPYAFIDGSEESELRRDLNLIWYTYESDVTDPGSFSILPDW